MDADVPQDLVFKVLASAAAIAAGVLVRQALETGWSLARGKEPPKNPESPLTDWTEALTWAAAVGVAVGVGRLAGRRAFTAAWGRELHRLPQVLRMR